MDVWVDALVDGSSEDRVRPAWWRPGKGIQRDYGSERVVVAGRALDVGGKQRDGDMCEVGQGGVNVEAEIVRVQLKVDSASKVKEELGTAMKLIYKAAEND